MILINKIKYLINKFKLLYKKQNELYIKKLNCDELDLIETILLDGSKAFYMIYFTDKNKSTMGIIVSLKETHLSPLFDC